MVESISMMEAPRIVTEVPGPRSREMLEKQDKYETASRTYTRFFRMAVDRASGSTVMDVDGNIFIDWFAGICVLNLGHNHPVVRAAIERQLDRLVHINEVPTEARVRFMETLLSTLPGSLRNRAKVMFTVTGADACEAAVSLARHVSKGRTIVAFGGAYHGVAGHIVGATANWHYREYAGLSAQDIYHLPYPYTYRFPVRMAEEDVSKAVVDMLRYLIRDPYSGAGKIGGVLVEPVQGEGGYIVPPKDFLPMLREVTEEEGIPLIVDEVQSGVGRTGKIWASEHSSVTPDIMCISKSIGGGIPTSMIAYRPEYDEGLPPGFHLGTYRGNPLALAAGEAILSYLKSSDLLPRVQRDGRKILEMFQEATERNPKLGEVRGLGFMIGVEFAGKDKRPEGEYVERLKHALFQNGLMMHSCGHYGNVMRFMAPLTIEDELVEKGMEVFERESRKLAGK